MRTKELIAAFLLAVGLCFVVSGMGYGEKIDISKGLPAMMREYLDAEKASSAMEVHFLDVRVGYMMRNPTGFLLIDLVYDPLGAIGKSWDFPEGLDTKDKICIGVVDNRGAFSNKSEAALLKQFEKELNIIWYSGLLLTVAPDMMDIVARFFNMEGVLLGYFYQGEYHLWGGE